MFDYPFGWEDMGDGIEVGPLMALVSQDRGEIIYSGVTLDAVQSFYADRSRFVLFGGFFRLAGYEERHDPTRIVVLFDRIRDL